MELELLQSMYIEGKEYSIVYEGANSVIITFDLGALFNKNEGDNMSGKDCFLEVSLKPESISNVRLYSAHSARDVSDLFINQSLISILDDIQSKIEHFVSLVTLNVKGHSSEYSEKSTKPELYRIIYSLDHIRNMAKYTKWMKNASSECKCSCVLYNVHRSIRVIVEGDIKDVKHFVSCNKSQNVDVDSRGMCFTLIL